MLRGATFITCLLSWLWSSRWVHASTVPCTTNQECERIIRKGSECLKGYCSNPYLKGGCLAQRLDGWKQIRVCSSDDAPDAIEQGHCRAPNPGFDYMELRIAGQNWESAFFTVWIIQILLSEILGVPVTLETGVPNYRLGFYDAQSRMDYGTSYDWSSVERASEIGDCRLGKKNPEASSSSAVDDDEPQQYQSCAHIIGEIWYGHDETLDRMVDQDIIERDHSTGTLGQQGLFIPRFTAMENPSFLTYLGLSGAAGNRTEARRAVARAFLRPTRWGEYCREVSPTQCTNDDDGVATRAPKTETEAAQFHSNEYLGHFRATDANDCDAHPDTCTGHFVDYPCGWSSFAKQQMHHLGINLVSEGNDPGSNGYTYTEMTEIWAAANATKSNVMMRWYWPEALYQTFLTSDAEFQRVSFPPPTLDCVDARVDSVTRCEGETEEIRLGRGLGSCDEPPYALRRVITKRLRDDTYDPNIPYELRSPGYDAIKQISVNGLQIGKIFDYWLKRGSDKWNFDPRDATCRWIAENYDVVRTWIPDTYPRATLENEEYFQEPLFYVSVALSLVALAITLFAATGVYLKRKTRAMVYAQVEFMSLLLVGMVCVTLGSVLLVVPASNWSCISVEWLTNLGYTLELIPLIVKIQAINNLLSAANNMRRKIVNRKKLLWEVFGITFLVAIFVAIWTFVDPPLKASQYDLTSELTKYQETVVRVSYFCQSESSVWRYLGAGWLTLMLIAATAMAFQTRKLRSDFNESSILVILIYSHLFFVVLRLLIFAFEGNLSIWNIPRYLSIVYSADTIMTSFIYFFPKIFVLTDESNRDLSSSIGTSGAGISGLRNVRPSLLGRSMIRAMPVEEDPVTTANTRANSQSDCYSDPMDLTAITPAAVDSSSTALTTNARSAISEQEYSSTANASLPTNDHHFPSLDVCESGSYDDTIGDHGDSPDNTRASSTVRFSFPGKDSFSSNKTSTK